MQAEVLHRQLIARFLVLVTVVVTACVGAPSTTPGDPPTSQPTQRPTPTPTPLSARLRSVSAFEGTVAASGDFRGSGKSQIALLQDPARDFTLRVTVREADGNGGALSESAWLSSPPGFFALARAKLAVADVTLDGKDDLVALYDDGDNKARLLVMRSTGTAFEMPAEWWRHGEYSWSRARNLLSGKFAPNGRDGLLVTYQLDNAQLRVHSFESNGSAFFLRGGGEGIYDSGPGAIDASRARFAVGHFTRTTGPQQVAVLYQYPNARVRLHVLDTHADGMTLVQNVYESGENEYDLARAVISAADVTGDGKDDVLGLYTRTDGSSLVHVFDAASSFKPANGWAGWATLPASAVCIGATGFLVGDWDGDRKADANAIVPAEQSKVRTNLLRNDGSAFTVSSSPETAACPRWPLTGLPLNGAIPTNRPLYVKIDNNPTARPHYGISKADQVYEWLVEGMTTRLAAVFHSQEPGVIGSVRSARMTDAPIVPSLAGALVYSGAGPEELMRLHYDDAVANRYIDLLPGYGWGYRVPFRPAPYNYFTTSELLRNALAAAPKGDLPVNVPPWSFLPLSATDPMQGGFASSVEATTITIPYRALFGVRYQYDPASRSYARFNDGAREVDGQNREPIAAKNILVIQTQVRLTTEWGTDAAGSPKLDMQLVGSGSGILFRDGRRQDVTWTRPDIFDVFSLKNAAGEVVQLAPGQTWIHIVPSDWAIPSQ